MDLEKLLPSSDQLKLAQGVEEALLRRRRRGTFGLATAGLGLVLLLAKALIDNAALLEWLAAAARLRAWPELSPEAWGELATLALTLAGLGAWFLLRYTDLLVGELREPFRYTFWIEEFTAAGGTPGERCELSCEDRLKLLHHDLRERLHQRIGRFSLLDEKSAGVSADALTSHIHVGGHYVLREDRKGEWLLHVMPHLRIGPPGSPASLADPVRHVVAKRTAEDGQRPVCELTAETYDQLVERVYSRLATAIYEQIERDVEQKIRLFPTAYLRAVALFHEAEDFARSNTIDAYDRALELYRKSRRYFDVAQFRRLTRLLARVPGLWRREARFMHMECRVRIGDAKCRIYRRELSGLTGRKANPLFEARGSLEEVREMIDGLQRPITQHGSRSGLDSILAVLSFPPDSLPRWLALRPLEAFHEAQRWIRFEAYAVSALASAYLDIYDEAEGFLQDAKSIDPVQSERNALYLLAAGVIEPRLDQKLIFLRRAAEAAPNFQIVRYLLAYWEEMRFRAQGELSVARAAPVLELYDEVLRINPGNVAALAAKGRLLWLTAATKERLEPARRALEEGWEIKAIVQETFVGELTYGLARIAAEEGDLERSRLLFEQALAAEPGVAGYMAAGAQLSPNSSISLYGYITSAMVRRYRRLARAVRRSARESGPASQTAATVESYVLNDYGNVRLNSYFRCRDRRSLVLACRLYERAVQRNPRNVVAQCNRYVARLWLGEHELEPRILEDIARALPRWHGPLDALKQSLKANRQRIEEQRKQCAEGQKQLDGALESKRAEGSGWEQRRRSVEEEIARLSGLRRSGGSGSAVEAIPPERVFALEESLKRERRKLEELEELQQRMVKVARGLLESAKLAPLLKAVEEQGARSLLGRSGIHWERLDDEDVAALREWMEVLSQSDTQEPGRLRNLREAVEVFEHIQDRYWPADFNTALALRDALLELSALAAQGAARPEQESMRRSLDRCRDIIRRAAAVYLEQDPVHANALDWHRDHFDPDDSRQVDVVRAALEAPPPERSYRRVLLADYEAWGRKLLTDPGPQAASMAARVVEVIDSNAARLMRASVHNRIGNQSFEDLQYRVAIREYARAIELDPEVAVYHSNLSLAWESLAEPGRIHENLLEAASALERAQRLEPLPERARRLAALRSKAGAVKHFGEPILGAAALATPVAIEIANDLVPHVEGESGGLHPAMQERVDRIRLLFREKLGVRVPGFRFRANEDLEPGVYVILLDEVPLATGTLPPGKLLCVLDHAERESHGLAGSAVEDPLTFQQLAWVDQEKRGQPGLPESAFLEPLQLLVNHVAHVLLAHLAHVFGHQEAEDAWKALRRTDGAPLPERTWDLTSLATTLRGLLAERVPIHRFERILELFEQGEAERLPVAQRIERIRLELRAELAGNDGTHQVYELGPGLESALRAGLTRAIEPAEEGPLLALEADAAQRVLAALRPVLGDRKVALATAPDLRRHVKALVRMEWPLVPVLSHAERMEGPQAVVAGRLEIEGGG